jgi:hypothetical protein
VKTKWNRPRRLHAISDRVGRQYRPEGAAGGGLERATSDGKRLSVLDCLRRAGSSAGARRRPRRCGDARRVATSLHRMDVSLPKAECDGLRTLFRSG